jgi:hypothetical protein
MTFPTVAFGLLFAGLYGALFHFWSKGSFLRLILYLVLSILGFWAGHYVGGWLGLNFWMVGALRIGPASLGSVLFLILGHWLSQVNLD